MTGSDMQDALEATAPIFSTCRLFITNSASDNSANIIVVKCKS